MSENIRNFCIIAHIDHGKSTLSDRIIDKCLSEGYRKKQDQVLDSLEIEREKGITIKSAVITLNYLSKSGKTYQLNLIDTPGHVDFTYEVSRSLKACEGAILIVDASQGIEAQTLSNYYLALDNGLSILPVLNKIDLPAAEPDKVSLDVEEELVIPKEDCVKISAKMGIGIEDLLEKIPAYFPAPSGSYGKPLKSLVFDSFFDPFRGVVLCIRVFDGVIKTKDSVSLFYQKTVYVVEEVGHLGLSRQKTDELRSGDVGYAILGIKRASDVRIGDTLIHEKDRTTIKPLDGYKEVKSMVFAGIFPIDTNDYADLQDAMEKLTLNDSAIHYAKDSSLALGFGFRCGFLGLLHMEIVAERLSREFGMEVMLTAPSVQYKIHMHDGKTLEIDNPALFPDPNYIRGVEEPYVKAIIITPEEYLGSIINLVVDKRGIQKDIKYNLKRVEAVFEIPLAEIVFDFYDLLKSLSKGYASMDYELIEYRDTEIVKVSILVNKEPIDALSFLVHKDKAREKGKRIIENLKEEIPRHMFNIPIQAAIGAAVIAREDISAYRKDVTSKCYGGDISRKRKLLEKQKEGKKKMKAIGNVNIPPRAFVNVLKLKQ